MLLTWNARMSHLFTSMEKSRARCWRPLFPCMERKTSKFAPMQWRAIHIFKYCWTLKSLLLFFHNYVVTCGTSAFNVSMYVWTWKTLAVGGFKRYLRKIVFFKSPFSLNPNFPTQFNPWVSWQIRLLWISQKIRTILYSLEPKNYTKLWVHGNWGRTETGDMTVLFLYG